MFVHDTLANGFLHGCVVAEYDQPPVVDPVGGGVIGKVVDPVPNANPTYVVSCCTFSSFRYFQTLLRICLLSHVMSPRILPFGLLQVCVNLASLLYIQAVGSNWT